MLYGSESGGTVRKGLLEQAERGVLFINELGDLSPAAQRLLFAALDTGSFQRAGGATPVALRRARDLARRSPASRRAAPSRSASTCCRTSTC